MASEYNDDATRCHCMAWPWEMGRLLWLQGHVVKILERQARGPKTRRTWTYLWSVNVYRYYSVEAGADGVLCQSGQVYTYSYTTDIDLT